MQNKFNLNNLRYTNVRNTTKHEHGYNHKSKENDSIINNIIVEIQFSHPEDCIFSISLIKLLYNQPV